jgi:dihydroorotate dehydrogenase electron transfer subunit
MQAGPFSLPARTIAVNEPVPKYIELTLGAPEIARAARPGQFVMLRAWPGADPLLPRPFDLMHADPETGTIVLFVKVEGRGTALLGLLEPGTTVQCTGPLGRPVEIPADGPIALLVRGAGAAAVVMLAAAAVRRGVAVYSFLSASTAGRIVCRDYLQPVSTELRVATDDGTAGYHGNATDLLDRLVGRGEWRSGTDRTPGRVYTCGSRRFARHVQSLETEGKARGFVFLEGLMACGLGDCHGCAVRKKGEPGYFLVCRDGPHFPVSWVMIE